MISSLSDWLAMPDPSNNTPVPFKWLELGTGLTLVQMSMVTRLLCKRSVKSVAYTAALPVCMRSKHALRGQQTGSLCTHHPVRKGHEHDAWD